MSALIPIREHDGRQAVSGRDLHAFLEVATPYKDWFPRMLAYGFSEGEDFSAILSESTGGRPAADHAMTLDMAKELAMLQRTPRGQEARRYFIEVEKRARAIAVPQTYAEALEAAAAQARRAEALEAKVAEDAPKVEYVETFVASEDLRLFRNVAKSLGVQEDALRSALIKHRWIYAEKSERWSNSQRRKVPVSRYSPMADKRDYFRPVPNHDAPRFRGELMHTLKITPQGAVAIARAAARWGLTPENER
ncbi:MAG: antA/AntB antirepressor family protein [Microbacterium sp.]